MRILGVDPGSRRCGYAVIEVDSAGDCTYVECGVLGAAERAPLEDRLAEITRDLHQVIAELAPGVVAVEDVFSGRNARSALALAHARGAVFAVAGTAGLRVCSYPPAVVKKRVAGNGRAPKEQVARMAAMLVRLRELPQADAADALAVALAHAREPVPR
jgi:crossover junction endodeoxyribonuclease RuvC